MPWYIRLIAWAIRAIASDEAAREFEREHDHEARQREARQRADAAARERRDRARYLSAIRAIDDATRAVRRLEHDKEMRAEADAHRPDPNPYE